MTDLHPAEPTNALARVATLNIWTDVFDHVPQGRLPDDVERHYLGSAFREQEVFVNGCRQGARITPGDDPFVTPVSAQTVLASCKTDRTLVADTGVYQFCRRENLAEIE
ncbi:MAG: hypothetical protein GDA53_04625 [Rhodobacteraceae bacterium]|nr:hypothetical protein [Paracoccaceae bacterium]